jgi:hypothetical protein
MRRWRIASAAGLLSLATAACTGGPVGSPGDFADVVAAAQAFADEVAEAANIDLGTLELYRLATRCGPVDQPLAGPRAVFWSDELSPTHSQRAALVAALEEAAASRGFIVSSGLGFLAANGTVQSDPMTGSLFAIGAVQFAMRQSRCRSSSP